MPDPTAAINSTTKHLPELDFTVVATAYSHHVDFIIYDIEGWGEGGTAGVFDVPLWDEAAPYLHGEVKWDGCSNWHFDEQDRVMLHGCTRKNVLRFGEVMAACWDWAAELCPAWNA